jgi:hypothetical protein
MTQSRRWQIGAAAIILLIAGIALYNNRNGAEPEPDTLAVNGKQQDDRAFKENVIRDSQSFSARLADTGKNQQERVDNTNTRSKEIPLPPLPARSTTEPGDQSAERKAGVSETASNQQEQPISQKAKSPEKESAETTSQPSASKRDNYKGQADAVAAHGGPDIPRPKSNQLNNFSGRVTDANNKPLANASLKIQDKEYLVTDESGYFNFSSKDSVVDVQVDLAGYENRNFRLQNDIASNKLVIEPRKESLQEVDVVGYGTQKKESTTSARTKTPDPLTSKKNRTKETVNVQGAVPVIGWIEYEKYLDKNKIPPLSNPLLKGEVVVSFQVKRQGTLSDFKIEKGLSKDYDAEALRLVREGPKWKILDGRRTRITVIVNF